MTRSSVVAYQVLPKTEISERETHALRSLGETRLGVRTLVFRVVFNTSRGGRKRLALPGKRSKKISSVGGMGKLGALFPLKSKVVLALDYPASAELLTSAAPDHIWSE